MTQNEAFLQAIREAPADDAPRLIYADWLEEHGQADRAEFIRIQCRLARMSETASEHSLLTARAESLLRTHWEEWVWPLRKIVGPWCYRYGETWMEEKDHPAALQQFKRGFVTGVSLETDSFVRQSRAVRFLIPQLERLHLWGVGGRGRELADTPELQGVATLAFTDYYEAPMTASDAAALAASPYLKGLSHLQLGWNSLGDAGVESLVQASWLASATVLNLSENGLSDRAARALAESPQLVNLRVLLLRRNAFSQAGIAALTNSPNLRSLTRLEYDPAPGNLLM
jgi:uncharacterized protein (TIGR02996 family)